MMVLGINGSHRKNGRTIDWHRIFLADRTYIGDFLAKFGNLPVGDLESSEKLEQLRALENGFRIKVVETPFDSIEVDRPADIKRVEELMAQPMANGQ